MTYKATINWSRKPSEAFTDNKYSRVHEWAFDGGIGVRASASPHVVPLPMSAEDAVDPEEAFVAILSSCHMLSFLSLAAGRNYVVDSYKDNAEGDLRKGANGKLAMTHVRLNPKVTFGGDNVPTPRQIDELHRLAHENCFIANSVRAEVRINHM